MFHGFLRGSRPLGLLPQHVQMQCQKLDRCITPVLCITTAGLCYDTNEIVLKEAFRQHGEIIEVKVICDRVSGKSKGYGFVHFTTEDAASAALKAMDGKEETSGCNMRIRIDEEGQLD
ncbi:hypothetical protein Tsubulata_042742, partial [Turnera subulata]